MDFLDPKKQRAHMIRLIVGYILIAFGILIGTVILLYQAYGFGFDRKGEIIQNGLVFVSSQPRGARIYLNTKLEKEQTNTKLQIPGGSYKLELQREGYHSWERQIRIDGGSVEHYDYPLLFPAKPKTTAVRTYEQAPELASQSPDRKWLLVVQPGTTTSFDVHDISDPELVATRITSFALPASIVPRAPAGSAQVVAVGEWSNNNRHVVLEYTAGDSKEYVLLDRVEPEQSVNLSRTLQLAPGAALSLQDKKYDKYYIFDPAAKVLTSTTLDQNPVPKQEVSGLVAFKSYGSDKILYATETGAAPGMVATMLKEGDTTYKIHEHPAAPPYLMDMVQYDRDWYVAVGSSGENKVSVYRNPQTVRRAGKQTPLIPVHVLKVTAPNYMAFSSNSQNLVVENGNAFAVYDADTDRGYIYTAPDAIESPSGHATWMDGHRLVYASGGKLVVFDYDNTNRRSFIDMNTAFLPFFDRDYRNLFTFQSGADGSPQVNLTTTGMLTDADK